MTPTPSALERLVDYVRQARRLGFLTDDWATLAEAALLENKSQWQSEAAFRLATGSGERWCQRNFPTHKTMGLARKNEKGQREWHQHARAPRGSAANGLIQQIRDDLN